MKRVIIVAFLLLRFGAASWAATYEFTVRHDHPTGSCRGRLVLDEQQVAYIAANGKHSRQWPYVDIQKLDVVSPKELKLTSFQSGSKWRLNRDKIYEFELSSGELTLEIQEFLRSKLSRPMIARLVRSTTADSATLPVRHRHKLGGCEGILRLQGDRIIYETDHASHNRAWIYRDMQTIGSSDPYNLRLTSFNETFTFDLKAPLDRKLYDALWDQVNGLTQ